MTHFRKLLNSDDELKEAYQTVIARLFPDGILPLAVEKDVDEGETLVVYPVKDW